MLDPEALFTLGTAVKEALVAFYADQGVALPARRLLIPSGRIDDCEQLAVQMAATQGHDGDVANPGAQDAARLGLAHALRAATVIVYVQRCVPGPQANGLPPTVQVSEDATRAILRDHSMLRNGILWAEETKVLPGCHGVAIGGWEMLEPAGGIGGSALTFTVDLAGFGI